MNKCRAYALRCMKEYIEIKVSEVFYFKTSLFTLKNYEKRSKYGHFHFLGLPGVFFSSHSPQIGTNPYILGLLSQKKGSKLNSLWWPFLVLGYLKLFLLLSDGGGKEGERRERHNVFWYFKNTTFFCTAPQYFIKLRK